MNIRLDDIVSVGKSFYFILFYFVHIGRNMVGIPEQQRLAAGGFIKLQCED